MKRILILSFLLMLITFTVKPVQAMPDLESDFSPEQTDVVIDISDAIQPDLIMDISCSHVATPLKFPMSEVLNNKTNTIAHNFDLWMLQRTSTNINWLVYTNETGSNALNQLNQKVIYTTDIQGLYRLEIGEDFESQCSIKEKAEDLQMDHAILDIEGRFGLQVGKFNPELNS